MQGTSVDIVKFNCELFQTVLLDIRWEPMYTMTNLIRRIDDAHMRFTINGFEQLRNDQRVGQITKSPILKTFRRMETGEV